MRSIYDMTNEEWQPFFEALRVATVPSSDKKMPRGKAGISVNRRSVQNSGNYCGETQYYYYVQTINSILDAIRKKNQCDYCWNLEQIKDLLKYERDRLQTEWKQEDKYFRVWLSKI